MLYTTRLKRGFWKTRTSREQGGLLLGGCGGVTPPKVSKYRENSGKLWYGKVGLFRSLLREVFPFSAIFLPNTNARSFEPAVKAHLIKFGQSYKNSIFGQFKGHPPPSPPPSKWVRDAPGREINLQGLHNVHIQMFIDKLFLFRSGVIC